MNYVQLIQQAIDYIETHLDSPLSLDEIASGCHLSKFHFSRIFKALTHCSFREYLLERRMVHAACRLRQSSEKIIDIAFNSGFRSPEVFTRNFHRFSGMSPSAYRNLQCGADLSLPQKLCISERVFKNINHTIVAACSLIRLEEKNIYYRSCRFNPDEAAGIEKATGFTSRFVDTYLTPNEISPLYTVTISENCSASHILYLAGYDSKIGIHQGRLRSFSMPAAQYADFRYQGEFGNIFHSVIDDILLSLAAQNLMPAKCGIDFFQRYDSDYKDKGFHLLIPVAS